MRLCDEGPFKGDHYTVYPDPCLAGRIRSSIRYEANHDAAQDYELLTILEGSDPPKAHELAAAAARDARSGCMRDIRLMRKKREELTCLTAKASGGMTRAAACKSVA